VPAGPMSTGLPNLEKAKVRERFAQGQATRDELLTAESAAYHGVGTCTFYGTANSNQMLLEAMGLHVPGAAFIHPHAGLREALTREAVRRLLGVLATAGPARFQPIGRLVDERAIVNAMVALLATGGSTNHLIHWVAVARAAGIRIDWNDFDELSGAVPLLARVYPNGRADVNQFQAAGGPGYVIGQLLEAGFMHGDVSTVASLATAPLTSLAATSTAAAANANANANATATATAAMAPPTQSLGLRAYAAVPSLGADGALNWQPALASDAEVVRPAAQPFEASGGLKLLTGNLGRSVIKVSAVPKANHIVQAPAMVFDSQEALLAAFNAGELERDLVAVVRFQGPRANGMPELHKLTPPLGVLQGRGFKVALATDGRMSGASGKVPAAIHLSPEALAGGPLAKVRDGDLIRLDAVAGTLDALVDAAEWAARAPAPMSAEQVEIHAHDLGRELFAGMRRNVTSAEEGAVTWL
jgi:phosphogluconate dehydratase